MSEKETTDRQRLREISETNFTLVAFVEFKSII